MQGSQSGIFRLLVLFNFIHYPMHPMYPLDFLLPLV
uniref:Uncharacterized protein n=1 Tax=Rhizophora mucronata TaxID=61149 RepID=A0A2P2NDL2_RHIMU